MNRAAMRGLRAAYLLLLVTAGSLLGATSVLAQTWTITATSGANGSISPSGSVLVPNATDTTFSMIPALGYEVADVVVDGGSVGAVTTFTFTNVTTNHTIHATFAVATHTLGVTIVGGGSVARSPNQPTYIYGTPVQLTATPDLGHQFAGWSGDVTGLTNPTTIIMNGDRTVTATFDRDAVGYERLPFAAPYAPITTGGGASTLLVAADDSTRSIPLPFNFVFSGIPYTTSNFLAVNANGFAHLSRTTVTTSSPSLSSNSNLYNSSVPNVTLAPWYDDLSVGAVGSNPSGRVLYQVQGSPGSRRLIVQWTDVSSFSTASGGQPRRINFQLVLLEGVNQVEFRYGAVIGGDFSTFESGSIGIEDSIGGKFLDAVTGSKSTSNGMMTTNKWPIFNFRFLPVVPGKIPAGTYTVGPGGYYVSLSEAVADVNHKGISGPITLRLIDNTVDSTLAHGGNVFPILLGPVDGATAVSPITIEPASGVATLTHAGTAAGNCGNSISITAIGTTNEPIFGVIGIDYVHIRNLNMVGGSLADRGLLVLPNSSTDGAQNNTFTNVAVSLDRTNTSSIGVQQILQVTPSSLSGTNSFNTYRALTVTNAYAGVSLAGRAPVLDTDCSVTGFAGQPTVIGADGLPGDIGGGASQAFGIRALNQANMTISDCVVRNVTGAGTSTVDGILLENSGALTASSGICQITRNVVHSLTNTSVSAGRVSGIRASLTANAASESRIYNNFVFDLNSGSSSPFPRRIVGIYLQEGGLGAGAIHNVDFNTVRLAPDNLTVQNACLEINTVTGPQMRVRNNILANFTDGQTGPSKHYAWVTPSATSIGPAGSLSDRNVLYIGNTVNGFTGLSLTTDRASLVDWQAVASNDLSSYSNNPQLVGPSNLHIDPLQPTPVESGGSMFGGLINWVTDDIDGDARNLATPDVGADEGIFVLPAAHDVAASVILEPLPGSSLISGTTFTPRASFENQGTMGETSIPVRFRIRGPQPATTIVYDQPGNLATLDAGTSSIVAFPTTSIGTGGIYTLEAIAELAGDDVPGNDLLAESFETIGPLAGDYLVGAAQPAPFNTLSGAVARLNTVGVAGPVRLLLTDTSYGLAESFPITVLSYPGASATNTLTLKPAPGVSVTMTGNNPAALIMLSGADHVIVDGAFTTGGTTRNWTLENSNGEGGAVVWVGSTVSADGATHNVVKNLLVRGTGLGTAVGVGIGGPGVGLSSNGVGNQSNRIENVAVERAHVGVYTSGSPGAGKSTGTVVTRNVLNAASPNHLSRAGIMVRFEDGIQITDNVIGNLASTGSEDVIGISVGLSILAVDLFTGDDVVNATVARNIVRGVSSTGPLEVSAAGIAVARVPTGTNTIVNNMISGVTSNAFEPSLTVGILAGGGGTTRVWFNSVWMSGDRGAANAASIGLAICDSTSSFNVRNNVLVNTQTASAGGKGFAIATVAAISFGNLVSNYNDFYSPTLGNDLAMVGGLDNQDEGDLTALLDWRTRTGRDLQSISADPNFVSASDLHINILSGPASPVGNIGQAIATVTDDVDGESGNRLTTPDMGADEFATYNLTTNVVGLGSVLRNPNATSYESGATVQLTAVPGVGYSFSGWSGALTGTTNPQNLLMNTHQIVTATFVINSYTMSVNSGGNGSVAKSPDQPNYNHGTAVQVTATPAPSYRFSGWSGDTTGTANPFTVIMNGNKTYTATFEINDFTLDVATSGNGTVNKNPNQPTYPNKTAVTLTAVPAPIHQFVGWTGDTTTTTNPLTLLMTRDRSLTANFSINTYTVNVSSGPNGSVSKEPDELLYDHGFQVDLTATPEPGYHFVSWGGDTMETANPMTIIVTRNRTITATFAINQYALNLSSGPHGAAGKTPNQALYNHGASVVLNATPDVGFHFVGWGGDTTEPANPMTVVMTRERNISAAFGHALTTAVVDSGSVVRSPNQANYVPGAEVTLTAVPKVGWHFVTWGGDTVETANAIDIVMNSDRLFIALFEINQYTMSVTAGANGAVTVDPVQALYDHGTMITIDALPAPGYDLLGWSGTASGSADPLVFAIDGDQNITATFGYRLTTAIVGSGSVRRTPNQQVYLPGTVVGFRALPPVGWTFTGWTGDTTTTVDSLVVTMTEGKSYTATFTVNTYTLGVSSGPNGSVTVSPPQPLYDHGTIVQLTAVPAVGYELQSWGGDASGSTSPLDVVMDGNKSVSATFVVATYELNVNVLGPGSVTVSPDLPIYVHGTVVELTAVPLSSGHHLVEWTGDAESFGAQLVINITMTSDKNLGATFVINENVPPVAEVLSPNGGEVLAEGQTATLTWNATDNVGVVAVDLFLSRNGPSGPFEHIAGPIPNHYPRFDWVVTLPATDNAYLRVVARDANGYTGADVSNTAFSIVPRTLDVTPDLPRVFAFASVFPNPATSQARIAFDVPQASPVRISVIDIQGREVVVLEDGVREPGRHQVSWNLRGVQTRRVAPGIYFLRMHTPVGPLTRRIVVAQ